MTAAAALVAAVVAVEASAGGSAANSSQEKVGPRRKPPHSCTVVGLYIVLDALSHCVVSGKNVNSSSGYRPLRAVSYTHLRAHETLMNL
eukprot:2235611-Prymnesium_polylepis.1